LAVLMKNHMITTPIVAGLILCMVLYYQADLIAGDKPLLSEAIAKEINTKGVAAATKQFASAYKTDKDQYTVDMEGISELGKKFMQENNFEAAGAVMQIAAPYMMMITLGAQDTYSAEMADQIAEEKHRQEDRQEQYQEQEKRSQEKLKAERDIAMKEPVSATSLTGTKPLIDLNVEFSAISYLDATNPGGRKYNSVLNINHGLKKTRFENKKKQHEPISIFRFDKGVIWLVHREKKRYAGLKLYQEFKLTTGMGIGSHVDHLMRARSTLLSPKGLKDMGKETINGHRTTHYYKKISNLGYEDGYDTYHYWVSDKGILIKMQLSAPEVGYTLETRDIKLTRQADGLFVPPDDYRKAGHRISWKEEKRKLDAINKN